MVKIEKVQMTSGTEKIKLTSPYHPELPSRAKALGGKFSGEKKAWYFDLRDEQRVRDLAIDLFGTDGENNTETVTLRVTFPQGHREHTDGVYVAGRCIARAYGRKSGAKLGDGVVLIRGDIGSGGSVQNWYTSIEPGSVFEIRDVPRQAAEKAMQGSGESIQIEIVDSKIDIEVLKAERERLLARIAEIDAILAANK